MRGAASRQSFYSMDVQQVPQGMGSGFIWDDKVPKARCSCPAWPALASVGTCLRQCTARAAQPFLYVMSEM